jgi:uncharacterized protein YegJ (DUF2314 family)
LIIASGDIERAESVERSPCFQSAAFIAIPENILKPPQNNMPEIKSTRRDLTENMTRMTAIAKGTFQADGLMVLLGATVMAVSTLSVRSANVIAQDLKQGSTEPEYYQVPKDQHHSAMRRAVKEARKTVKNFINALEHPGPGQQDFEVKKPFIQGSDVEHIWLSDVRFINQHFEGRIDNQPRKITGLKLGQIVSVEPKDISDWLYIDNGKLVGGYTVRVHYSELSPEQKQVFDRQADFKIEKP